MRVYDFTENEMLYLMTIMGAEEPAGREWFEKKSSAEKSLGEKGLMEMGFDGNELNSELRNALQEMISSHIEINVVLRQPGQTDTKESIYYISDTNNLMLTTLPDHMLRLQEADAKKMKEEFTVPKASADTSVQGKLTMKMDQINEAYNSAKANEHNDAELKISDLGAPSSMADQIVGVAENRTGIFSVLFKNNTPNKERASSYSILLGENLILMEGEDTEDGSMDITYTIVDQEAAQAGLVMAAEKAGISLEALTKEEEKFA